VGYSELAINQFVVKLFLKFNMCIDLFIYFIYKKKKNKMKIKINLFYL
jgi:hypothetical protein